MRLTLFSLLGLFIAINVSNAQNDKLFLENGSLLKGSIVRVGVDHLNILIDADTISLSKASIKSAKLSKSSRQNVELKDQLLTIFQENKKGPNILIGLGGFVDDDYDGAQMRTSLSLGGMYQFGQHLQVGLATDIMWYENFATMPVYLTYKGSFSPFNRGIFYYVGYGQSFGWEREDCNCNDLETGRFLKAGLGYQFNTGSVPMHVSIGWMQQKISLKYDNPWDSWFAPGDYSYTLKQRLNSVEMKLGVTF